MSQIAPLDPQQIATAAMKLLMGNPLFKVTEAEIRGQTYRVFENIPSNLGDYFQQCAEMHGEKDVLIYNDERITMAQLWRRGCQFANAIKKEFKVKPGDRVAIAMRNYPEWCVAYIGLASLGAVCVPLNAWWKAEELKFALKDCGAKIVIVDAKRLERLLPYKEELGLSLILAREESEGADARFDHMLEHADDDAPSGGNISPDDDFSIVFLCRCMMVDYSLSVNKMWSPPGHCDKT